MREDVSMRGTGSQHAYVEIRRQVVSLELTPGTRLFEEALATSLGVSRTPLREALRQLISENLLERLPAGGLAVPALDAREISELYECRAAIEGLMAEEAAAKIRDVDVERLDGLVARNRALVDFPEDAMQYGKALHEAIAEIADNAWAQRLHEQVSNAMTRYRRYTNHSEARRAEALEQHQQLAEVLRARDGKAAGILARAHVLGARDEVLRALSEAGIQG
jgi:DNA-binding GntR family transcriptional regulator